MLHAGSIGARLPTSPKFVETARINRARFETYPTASSSSSRPSISVQRGSRSDRQYQLLFDVAEAEAGDGGDGEGTETVAEDFVEAEAGAFDAAVAAAAEDDAGGVVEHPAEGEKRRAFGRAVGLSWTSSRKTIALVVSGW